MKGKMIAMGAALILVVALSSCVNTKRVVTSATTPQKSIVILYENDVHCEIAGYAKLAGFRDAIAASDTAYAVAVCSGDYLQGGPVGAVSHGQYIIDIMSRVGYAAVTLGNHEFDYGVPRMKELMPKLGAPVVCANFYDIGADGPFYMPYVIHTYGNKRVAFIGATTPETMNSEKYSFYDIDGNQLYDLRLADFYSLIQQAANKARSEGADYVVLLSHVGEDPFEMNVDSHQLIQATTGIDVVLDGHTHSVIPRDMIINNAGSPIPISQTGTQFANVGKLVITPEGKISTELIPTPQIPYISERVKHAIDSINIEQEKVTSRFVCTNDNILRAYDDNGIRLVRQMETNLGDLITDAFRHAMDAEIAFQNGGGIRNNLQAGDVTYGNIISVDPFDNTMCKLEVSGEKILEMLEKCTSTLPKEDGSFPHCSGLRFTIHSLSHTISDVEVLQADGSYQPFDPKRNYTVAISSYYRDGGYYEVLKNCTVLRFTNTLTRDILADYLSKELQGKIGGDYVQSQQRIKIIND